MKSPIKIFLTGAGGFIGCHLLKALISEPDRFHVTCAGHNERPGFGAYDLIVHLAATTTLSQEFNQRLYDDNIIYTRQIFNDAEAMDTKIIYASSTSAAELTNPYAYTKRYAESLGEANGKAVGLRFFNVYGAGNNKGIIKHAIDCARAIKPIEVRGGFQIRDFIYIDDVVDAIIASFNWEPGIYDVGTGIGTSIIEAIGVIEVVMRHKFIIKFLPMSQGDMVKSVASYGIPNAISLDEGIINTICS